MGKKLKRKPLNSPVSVKAVRRKGWGLWREEFKEKVSFEFRVEKSMSDRQVVHSKCSSHARYHFVVKRSKVKITRPHKTNLSTKCAKTDKWILKIGSNVLTKYHTL